MAETIGKRILQRRRELDMSQETLSMKSGVSRPVISGLESGTRKDVLVSTLTDIASALDVPVDFF